MVRLCVSACVHMKPVSVVGNVEGNGAGQPASTPALPSFRGVSVKFKLERLVFEQAFNESADAAHAINASGQTPVAALEVVNMFQRELLALCPWLDLISRQQAADVLREAVKLN